jgi:acyl dehydratase
MGELEILSLEEMKKRVGSELFTGDWLEMDQERINAFADCTEDRQWIHVDEEKAKEGPFGAPIAHGFLTLSLLTKLSAGKGLVPEGTKMAVNYGFNSVRFTAPVKVGSRIRDRAVLQGVEEKEGGRILVNTSHTVEIEGEEKPALKAEWLFMFYT